MLWTGTPRHHVVRLNHDVCWRATQTSRWETLLVDGSVGGASHHQRSCPSRDWVADMSCAPSQATSELSVNLSIMLSTKQFQDCKVQSQAHANGELDSQMLPPTMAQTVLKELSTLAMNWQTTISD